MIRHVFRWVMARKLKARDVLDGWPRSRSTTSAARPSETWEKDYKQLLVIGWSYDNCMALRAEQITTEAYHENQNLMHARWSRGQVRSMPGGPELFNGRYYMLGEREMECDKLRRVWDRLGASA